MPVLGTGFEIIQAIIEWRQLAAAGRADEKLVDVYEVASLVPNMVIITEYLIMLRMMIK